MLHRPMRVYADTSVYGGTFDPEFARATGLFFDQLRKGRFSLVTSRVVAEEIGDAPQRVREYFAAHLPLAEVADVTEEALFLADAYISSGAVPPKSVGDAMHVAIATLSGCRLLSWNFRHIVHYRRVALFNLVNVRNGCGEVQISSPREVIEYEEGL